MHGLWNVQRLQGRRQLKGRVPFIAPIFLRKEGAKQAAFDKKILILIGHHSVSA